MNQFEKYSAIHNEVMTRLENGEITIESAKEVIDLSFDKYITEGVFDKFRKSSKDDEEAFKHYNPGKIPPDQKLIKQAEDLLKRFDRKYGPDSGFHKRLLEVIEAAKNATTKEQQDTVRSHIRGGYSIINQPKMSKREENEEAFKHYNPGKIPPDQKLIKQAEEGAKQILKVYGMSDPNKMYSKARDLVERAKNAITKEDQDKVKKQIATLYKLVKSGQTVPVNRINRILKEIDHLLSGIPNNHPLYKEIEQFESMVKGKEHTEDTNEISKFEKQLKILTNKSKKFHQQNN